MKSAKMIDILNVWIKNFGGKYKIIDERPGERVDEYLIGQEELQYTTELKNKKKLII
jgi:hypothetical protein